MTVLQFVPANSFRVGRALPPSSVVLPSFSGVDNIVLHTAECSETKKSALAVAKFFKSKKTKTSAHFTVDDAERIQCVKLSDTAYHASAINSKSLGVEICGRAAQSLQEWYDDFSTAALENAALLCADMWLLFDVPKVKLVAEDLLANKRGFCGHVDVSKACTIAKARKLINSPYYHAKSNGHYDPGPNFPWGEFLRAVDFYSGVTDSKEAVLLKYAA